jgi:hypothetical protein
MCVPLKTKNQKQNSGVHNATWGLCYPMFWGISHKTAFLRTKWHWTGKVVHPNVSKCSHCNYWTDDFSNTFLMIEQWWRRCGFYKRHQK